MLAEAVRAIIDLLRIRQESKKADIDIRKGALKMSRLEREDALHRSNIQIATLDDVRKYDPRVAAVGGLLSPPSAPSPAQQASAFESEEARASANLIVLLAVAGLLAVIAALVVCWPSLEGFLSGI